MNSYTLSRQWFAFAFENQKLVKPVHCALYFWLIELANRMGWPAEFGNPGSQCMAACGIGSYNTYKKAFDDLNEWGFVKVVQKSLNQHTAAIIALSIIDEAQYKALDRAIISTVKNCKSTVQSNHQSTVQSTDSINKPITNKPLNLEPLTNTLPLFENENKEGLPLKTEKPKEKSSAKKEKVLPHLLANSHYADLETFLAAFPAKDYQGIDLVSYHNTFLDWSAANGSKKIDWIAFARNWMRGDAQKGVLRYKKGQAPQPNSKIQERVGVMQEVQQNRKYDKDGNRIAA